MVAESLGPLGEQADKEVNPTEVAVTEAVQPEPDLWLDLDLVQIGHASDDICISCYGQALIGRQLAVAGVRRYRRDRVCGLCQ